MGKEKMKSIVSCLDAQCPLRGVKTGLCWKRRGVPCPEGHVRIVNVWHRANGERITFAEHAKSDGPIEGAELAFVGDTPEVVTKYREWVFILLAFVLFVAIGVAGATIQRFRDLEARVDVVEMVVGIETKGEK